MNAYTKRQSLKFLIFSMFIQEWLTRYANGKSPVQVNYSEIQRMNASCANTCSNPEYSDSADVLSFHNCECGSHCTKYSTCCVDSPHRIHVSWRNIHQIPECISLDVSENVSNNLTTIQKKSYWMVSTCHQRIPVDQIVKDMCQRTSDAGDPFARIPARDIETNITYKNFFCGICNGVQPEKLNLWKIAFYKIQKRQNSGGLVIEESFIDQLVFDESFNSWGIWENENGSAVFKKVFTYPSESSAELCIPNLISDCDTRWVGPRKRKIRKKCYAYMAPIYVKDALPMNWRRYRNVHCAICNFVNVTKGLECQQLDPTGLDESMYPLSFVLLLDINTKNGDKVGEIKRCKRGESYDPFFKKCRSLVCVFPGYTLQDGHCKKNE